MELGIERILKEPKLRDRLKKKRIGLVAHAASVDHRGVHSIDLLMKSKGIHLSCAFGPQHGMKQDKQYNMIESDDYVDPVHQIPVYSLYGKTRRPTEKMMQDLDLILFDLQDVGTRIFTYQTTLLYMLEACAKWKKECWVLDRPNPAGRPIEGSLLESGWTSFVGAIEGIPIRHGLTLGELARYFQRAKNLDVDLEVIKMKGYRTRQAPGWGWPVGELLWVNPSPNIAKWTTPRIYPGTVLLEGTHLSEGRGTTHPLEVVGGPGQDALAILQEMLRLQKAWTKGAVLRACYFEPTFYKHQGKLCSGIQFHVETQDYDPERFRAYRLVALYFKALKRVHPDLELWRKFDYEYETERLAIDLINGGPFLREWVDDSEAAPGDLEKRLKKDESFWKKSRQDYLLYKS